jgi:hypothetical protein
VLQKVVDSSGASLYLQEADIIAGDCLDQMLRRRDLAKSHLEMVGIWKTVNTVP